MFWTIFDRILKIVDWIPNSAVEDPDNGLYGCYVVSIE